MKWLFAYGFINSIALWVAIILVAGIRAPGNIIALLFVMSLFGLVSILIRPLLWLLTLPLILITVWPMMLMLDALLLWSYAWLALNLGLDFRIEGFMPALLGALVIGIVRVAGIGFVRSQERRHMSRREQAWLTELERYRVWLVEQRAYWQGLAEEREQIIKERQILMARGLRIDDTDSQPLQSEATHSLPTEQSSLNWRKRIYFILYRWHEPFYHRYKDRGWTWLTPFKEKISQSLLRHN